MSWFNNLSIGTRIIGGFFVLALVVLGVGAWGLTGMRQINDSLKNANENLLPSVRALGDARSAAGTVQRTERSAIMATRKGDETIRRQALGAWESAWGQCNEALARYEALPMEEKEKRLWAEFKPLFDQFRRDSEATVAALRAGDLARAEDLCFASMANTNATYASLTGLCDFQAEVGNRESRQAQSEYDSARSSMLVVVGAAVVAALALGWFFRALIVRPLAAAVQVLESLSAGDLTRKATVSSEDEFGRMGRAMNNAVTGIHTALKQDRVNWEEVGRQHEHNLDLANQLKAVGQAQAVIEFKLDGTVVQANDNMLRAVGYTASEVVGRHHRMFVEPEYAAGAEYREFWAKLNRGEPVLGQFRRIGKGGKEVWLQAVYSPIPDATGRPCKVVKFAADVTSAKEMEKKIREDAAQLKQKVAAVMTGVTAVAGGDFTVSIPDLGTDDVGRMAASLNTAVVSVRTALEGVREVAEQLAEASGQLSSASEEISTGAQEQASSLEETASSLQEITATVKQSADNAQQARQLAGGSKEAAERGGQVVSGAVGAMSEINGSSKKIADIITTIDEIAFQTNLLALNAAVEAARAGEQGRGFAVVASEVRNLAQRSATAAKEIKALIQDSVKKVDAGTELVNKSGDTLAEIVTSVKRVSDIVTEIAAASKEQFAGVEQVNKAVSQMDSVTQRNASQTEEMSATAQALTDQAGQLRDLVARFKLGHAGSAPAVRPAKRSGAPRPAVSKALRRAGNGRGSRDGHGHELDAMGGDGFSEF
ncbi:methyl-accepting chemotaxis protein [Gemmata sp. JC717]|uniref:methyl-accepting chemotaxis protein n=1 Tax=Gemmata algarum TaxID=2975278 RepID=UPI0021BBB6B3|nr:methyl-accepting chemotaxis protein [Gemmata algarum]MDY3553418.1 methyl-accepting chemotaxis protein [Gemmata algarum]